MNNKILIIPLKQKALYGIMLATLSFLVISCQSTQTVSDPAKLIEIYVNENAQSSQPVRYYGNKNDYDYFKIGNKSLKVQENCTQIGLPFFNPQKRFPFVSFNSGTYVKYFPQSIKITESKKNSLIFFPSED